MTGGPRARDGLALRDPGNDRRLPLKAQPAAAVDASRRHSCVGLALRLVLGPGFVSAQGAARELVLPNRRSLRAWSTARRLAIHGPSPLSSRRLPIRLFVLTTIAVTCRMWVSRASRPWTLSDLTPVKSTTRWRRPHVGALVRLKRDWCSPRTPRSRATETHRTTAPTPAGFLGPSAHRPDTWCPPKPASETVDSAGAGAGGLTRRQKGQTSVAGGHCGGGSSDPNLVFPGSTAGEARRLSHRRFYRHGVVMDFALSGSPRFGAARPATARAATTCSGPRSSGLAPRGGTAASFVGAGLGSSAAVRPPSDEQTGA
jgi:hypothetical protein